MRIQPKHILGGSIILLLLAFFMYRFFAERNYSIENRTWDVCLKSDFNNPEGDCSYFITYIFNEDGSFTEFRKLPPKTNQTNLSNKELSWKLEENVLTTEVRIDTYRNVTKRTILWINADTFYTVEKNSQGVTTETYYEARD